MGCLDGSEHLYSFSFHVSRTKDAVWSSHICTLAGQLDNLSLSCSSCFEATTFSISSFISSFFYSLFPSSPTPFSPTTLHPSRTQPIPWSKEVIIGLEILILRWNTYGILKCEKCVTTVCSCDRYLCYNILKWPTRCNCVG